MKITIAFDPSTEQNSADVALLDDRRRFPFCKIRKHDIKEGQKYAHYYVEIPASQPQHDSATR